MGASLERLGRRPQTATKFEYSCRLPEGFRILGIRMEVSRFHVVQSQIDWSE